jgi:hypothetical protein
MRKINNPQAAQEPEQVVGYLRDPVKRHEKDLKFGEYIDELFCPAATHLELLGVSERVEIQLVEGVVRQIEELQVGHVAEHVFRGV